MIFGRQPSDPVAAAEAELAKHRDREATLQSQLEAASEAVRAAAQARQALLLDEDAAALARASAALETAQARERDARDRHAAAVAKRQAAETQLAELKDQAARSAEAATLQKIRANIEAKCDAHVKAAVGLFEALEAVNIGRGLAAQVDVQTAALRTEIAAQVLRVLDRQIEGINAGMLPLPGEQRPSPPVAETITRVPTYVVESLRWHDPESGPTSATKYAIVQLPEGAARRARELGIGHDPGESMRLQERHGRHYGPDARYCADRLHDLDALAESEAA
jgi:multidrug efflux pump subunit AcrA (membrane-fusion protein)